MHSQIHMHYHSNFHKLFSQSQFILWLATHNHTKRHRNSELPATQKRGNRFGVWTEEEKKLRELLTETALTNYQARLLNWLWIPFAIGLALSERDNCVEYCLARSTLRLVDDDKYDKCDWLGVVNGGFNSQLGINCKLPALQYLLDKINCVCRVTDTYLYRSYVDVCQSTNNQFRMVSSYRRIIEYCYFLSLVRKSRSLWEF